MPNTTSKFSIAKLALSALVIVLAVGCGMFLGNLYKGATEEVSQVDYDVFTHLTLVEGVAFPDIPLQDSVFDSVNSIKLLNERGTVVLFMEPNCPPCHQLHRRWQQALADGLLTSGQVIGISYSDQLSFTELRDSALPGFPIYIDPAYTFMRDCGVDGFPLILVVGASGVIRYKTIDANETLSQDDLLAALRN